MADQPYWNPSDKDTGNTLTDSDRTSTQAASNSGGVRSTAYLSTGKWYVEITVTNDNRYRTGVANSSYAVSANPGDTANSWTFRGGDGAKYHNATADTAYWGTPTSSGDTLMIAVDVDNTRIWWGVNGTWCGSGNPATNSNPGYTNLSSSVALLFGSNASSGTKVNTLKQLGSYAYSPPTGFTAGWGGTAGSVAGEAIISESDDSVAANGVLDLAAAAAANEDDDGVSATSTLLLRATASITQADDVVSAVIGITPVLADGAITEADDSVSSAGALLIQGSASITGGDDSLTGAGALFVLAAGSAIGDDDSVASAAALLIQGGAAVDEDADAILATGTLPITGAAGLVEDDDSIVANDYVPRGRVNLYEDDDYLRVHGGISAAWMEEQATKGDIPNWNHCARCHKEMRPNQMLQQNRRVGSTVVWTGIYVCPDCWDPIHPQDCWPRKTGGDPRPVPNARPFRGG